MNTIRFDRLRACVTALRKSPSPSTFTMARVAAFDRDGRLCPGCVWGHYFIRSRLASLYEAAEAFFGRNLMHEFGISITQCEELFGVAGCGGARTTDEAIAYLERFIAEHGGMPQSVREIFEGVREDEPEGEPA